MYEQLLGRPPLSDLPVVFGGYLLIRDFCQLALQGTEINVLHCHDN